MVHHVLVELAAIPTAYRWVLIGATALIIGSLLTLASVYSPPARRARAKERERAALPTGDLPFERLGTRLARLVEEQEAVPLTLQVVIPSELPPEPGRTGPGKPDHRADDAWLVAGPPRPLAPTLPATTPPPLPFVAQDPPLQEEPRPPFSPAALVVPPLRQSELLTPPPPRLEAPPLPTLQAPPRPHQAPPPEREAGEGADPPRWVQQLTQAGLLKPAHLGMPPQGRDAQVTSPSAPKGGWSSAAPEEPEADETEGVQRVWLDLSVLPALPEDEAGDAAHGQSAGIPADEELRAEEDEPGGVLEAVDLSQLLREESALGEGAERSETGEATPEEEEESEEEPQRLAPGQQEAVQEEEAPIAEEAPQDEVAGEVGETCARVRSEEPPAGSVQAPISPALTPAEEEPAPLPALPAAVLPVSTRLRLQGFGEPVLLAGDVPLLSGPQRRPLELLLVLAHAAVEQGRRTQGPFLTRLFIGDALWPEEKEETNLLAWVRNAKRKVVKALKEAGLPEEALVLTDQENRLALAPEVSTDLGEMMQVVTTLARLSQTPAEQRAATAARPEEVRAQVDRLRQLYQHGFARGMGKRAWLDEARRWYHARYQHALVNAAQALFRAGAVQEAVEVATGVLHTHPNQPELVQRVLTWLRPEGQAAVVQWADELSAWVEQEGTRRLNANVSQLLFEARRSPSS